MPNTLRDVAVASIELLVVELIRLRGFGSVALLTFGASPRPHQTQTPGRTEFSSNGYQTPPNIAQRTSNWVGLWYVRDPDTHAAMAAMSLEQ